ncbi:hypothetical protein JCM10207_008874 [Rhodosporidiobolus poonsookiae]
MAALPPSIPPSAPSHSSPPFTTPRSDDPAPPPTTTDPAPSSQPVTPDAHASTTAEGSATGRAASKPRPPRHVAWNEEVTAHVAIPVAFDDDGEGGSADEDVGAALSRLRRGSTASQTGNLGGGDPFSNRYRVDDIPISLVGGQDDGALDGLVSAATQKLEVYVDPLERDGLPSLPAGEAQASAEKQEAEHTAQGIIQASTGGFGLWDGLRKRRNSIRKLGENDREDDEKIERAAPRSFVDEAPSIAPAPGGPGILAALIALQREEAALAADTPASSAFPTPNSSAPNSPHLSPADPYLDDSSDDEERERFLERRRLKRASKNAVHHASSSVVHASKHAASSAFHAATGGAFRGGAGERGRTFGPASRSGSTSTLSALSEEQSQSRSRSRSRASPASSTRPLSPDQRSQSSLSSPSLNGPSSPTSPLSAPPLSASSPSFPTHQRSQSSSAVPRITSTVSLSRLSAGSRSPPTSPVEPGVHVPHRAKLTSELTKRVRKLGDRLGLELETEKSRPAAARSGAGVFGGLVLGTAALVAPATPAGSSLAPLPTRPGYHLSRFSAPDVKPSSASSSPTNSRPGTAGSPSSATPRRTLSPPPTAGPSSPPRSPAQRSFDSSSRAQSRKSLSEMVREEEEIEREEQRAARPRSAGHSPAASPPLAPPAIAERRGRRQKKAVFSLQLNDLPSPSDDDFRKTSPPSSRPSLTISTTGLAPTPPTRHSASPTSATGGTLRFFGPRTPGTASIHTPLQEYFGASAVSAQIAAEKERERALRKAREEVEREAREREKDLREWQREKKRRRKQREKELKARRVFITAHVAAILERQDFILKLSRAFMMFGAPSHRLEAQIQATARVLELPHCTAMYLPGLMLVNFADPATYTSDIKFLKQPSGLDFGKLKSTYSIYSKVIRDKLSVNDASQRLDELMTSPGKYSLWQNVLLGGLAGAFIMPSAFYASFIDCLAAIPLGALVVLAQVFLARNDLGMPLFEIVVCCINAVIAGALSYSNQFCFYSIAAGSIVLVLPGFIALCASLEVANRSVVSGSVRMVYAALYSLLLGFGLSAGAEIYTLGGRETLAGNGDYQCGYLRTNAPWWRATIPAWWYFLTIPGFLFCMALKHGQPLFRRDTLAMILIGCAAFTTNYFSARAFVNMPALTSALGAFVVGILGNVWSRLTRESAFVVMIVGLFVQLPSGLANGGLLSFAQSSTRRTVNNFSNAVNAAAGLVRTITGISVGLFAAVAFLNLVSRRGRKRGAHLSTF